MSAQRSERLVGAVEELLRLPRVLQMTGLSRAELYRRIASGQYPKPLKRGRSSVWPLTEVQQAIAAEIEQLRAA